MKVLLKMLTKSLSNTIGLIEFSEKGSNGRFILERCMGSGKDHPVLEVA